MVVRWDCVFVLMALAFLVTGVPGVLSIKLDNSDALDGSIAPRWGSCGSGEILLFSVGSKTICTNSFVFVAAIGVYIARSAILAYAHQNWATTVKKQENFIEETTHMKSISFSIDTHSPNWDYLGIVPVINDDGSKTYEYNADVQKQYSTESLSTESLQEAGLSENMKKHREIYTSDGFLKNVKTTSNFVIDSGSGKDKREEYDFTFSYSAAPRHDKTDLPLDQAFDLFSQDMSEAIDREPSASGFGGHANNGGNWQGTLV